MWPDRRLADFLRIDHPIRQAPMARAANPEPASAVCNQDDLAALGPAEMTIDQGCTQVGAPEARTYRPFHLNLFVGDAPATDPAVPARTRDRLPTCYHRLDPGKPPETPPRSFPPFRRRSPRVPSRRSSRHGQL